MTNNEIIMHARLALAEAGTIANTAEIIAHREDGTPVFLPEEIHTFAAWKARGFSVKKGQHAVASFSVWKHRPGRSVEVENPETGETETEERPARMFLQRAAFFSASQVERITA